MHRGDVGGRAVVIENQIEQIGRETVLCHLDLLFQIGIACNGEGHGGLQLRKTFVGGSRQCQAGTGLRLFGEPLAIATRHGVIPLPEIRIDEQRDIASTHRNGTRLGRNGQIGRIRGLLENERMHRLCAGIEDDIRAARLRIIVGRRRKIDRRSPFARFGTHREPSGRFGFLDPPCTGGFNRENLRIIAGTDPHGGRIIPSSGRSECKHGFSRAVGAIVSARRAGQHRRQGRKQCEQ